MAMFINEYCTRLLHIGIRARDRGASLLCSVAVRMWLKAWGAECGIQLQVRGWPIVRRALSSTMKIGARCVFRSAKSSNMAGMNRPCYICTLRNGAILQIGDNCGFSATSICAARSIVIGNNVRCGANTTITDTDWHGIPVHLRNDIASIGTAPVVIEDDVWLGMHVTVLKGVHIGAGTVVAAGSVVSKDLPVGVIAGGVPARVLRPMTADELTLR
jgi:acetyltransferase-like isoleucine patch superfamily enzyme